MEDIKTLHFKYKVGSRVIVNHPIGGYRGEEGIIRKIIIYREKPHEGYRVQIGNIINNYLQRDLFKPIECVKFKTKL